LPIEWESEKGEIARAFEEAFWALSAKENATFWSGIFTSLAERLWTDFMPKIFLFFSSPPRLASFIYLASPELTFPR
jgi:hypothetical protein